MPNSAGIGIPNVATVFLDIGNDQNIGVIRVAIVGENILLHVAQSPGKSKKSGGCEGLLTDAKDTSIIELPLELCKGRVVDFT
jgi:hypothetical protein